MRLKFLAALLFALLPTAARAGDPALLNTAFERAALTFDRARPKLEAQTFGVDITAYGDALKRLRFNAGSGSLAVEREIRAEASGSCGRFAAFVRLPAENGAIRLVLCPQFFTDGADDLRELTILHEMVHVVAGTGECQAMAFAAAVQQAATGHFTPVTAYWNASNCANSSFSLPR